MSDNLWLVLNVKSNIVLRFLTGPSLKISTAIQTGVCN